MRAGTDGLFHPLPTSRATLKCRCAPHAQPVEPEKPMSCPSFTRGDDGRALRHPEVPRIRVVVLVTARVVPLAHGVDASTRERDADLGHVAQRRGNRVGSRWRRGQEGADKESGGKVHIGPADNGDKWLGYFPAQLSRGLKAYHQGPHGSSAWSWGLEPSLSSERVAFSERAPVSSPARRPVAKMPRRALRGR